MSRSRFFLLETGVALISIGADGLPRQSATAQGCLSIPKARVPESAQHRLTGGGFTLVHLLTTIVVIGLITAIAIPRSGALIRNARLGSAAQQLVGDLHRARVEAIKRNQAVYIAQAGSTGYMIEFIGARELPGAVSFGAGVPDTVRFASFGLTLTGAATYTLTLGGKTRMVDVNASGIARVR